MERIPLHAGGKVDVLAWDPTGAPRLCAVRNDGCAVVWDTDTTEVVRELGVVRPDMYLHGAAWVERGLFIDVFESTRDGPEMTARRHVGPGVLELYDVARGECLRSWPLPPYASMRGVTPDGRWASVQFKSNPHLLDLDSGRLEPGEHTGPWVRAPREHAISPDERWWARATGSLVQLLDQRTGREPVAQAQRLEEETRVREVLKERRLQGNSRTSPDGSRRVDLAVDWEWADPYRTDDVAHLRVTDVETGITLGEATDRSHVPCGLGPFAQDGRRLLARTDAGGGASGLVWIDAATLEVAPHTVDERPGLYNRRLMVRSPFLLSDGRRLLALGSESRAVVMDFHTAHAQPIEGDPRNAEVCALAPDESQALLWNAGHRWLCLVDLVRLRLVATLDLPDDLDYALFPDARTFIVRTSAGAVLTFEIEA